MCKQTEPTHNNSSNSSIVFLNTPISNAKDDIIGFDAHVNGLRNAIDTGAQIIAVTSPFGTGKSSIAELLRLSIGNKAKFISISMWSHLCDLNSDSTTDLHKSFLYQLVSKINPRKGEYINRTLSANYGVLKLHTKNRFYSFLTFLAIGLFILGYVFPQVFKIGLPVFIGFGSPEMWNNLFVLLSVICTAVVIVFAEIVFSSNKSEGQRTIDNNDIFELYRKFVRSELGGKIRHKLKKALKMRAPEKYIVVIEDLDRSDNSNSVITFLKELRKYYLQDIYDLTNGSPNIVFIVNVKPESALYHNHSQYKQNENESLYAKLFDYVLNLQTINIADYETILESILQKREDNLRKKLGFYGDKMVNIPGMQWIIRGKNLGLRDIKDRLNRAFIIYDSLTCRFPDPNISFEKCAVAAYLTTAYENDFFHTADDSFGKLVEEHLQHKLSSSVCKDILKSDNASYIDDVFTLVQSKLIDGNYRMYFYNYPKESVVYTNDQLIVQNSILYDEHSDGLSDIALRVSVESPDIIYNTFERVEALKIPFPNTVFKTEPLFIEALRSFPKHVYSWINALDYSENSYEKTAQQLLQLLKYDKDRVIYTPEHISSMCKIWEEQFSEKALLKFRKLLCVNFANEIQRYSTLFSGVHNLISIEEMEFLSLENAIDLIDIQKDGFDINYVEAVRSRFEQEQVENDSLYRREKVKSFLNASSEVIKKSIISVELLRYMENTNSIIPEFEEITMFLLQHSGVPAEKKAELFSLYQGIINDVATIGLSAQTLNNIGQLKNYKGFSMDVSIALVQGGYIFDGIIIALLNNQPVEFDNIQVVTAIEENLPWLIKNSAYFTLIRKAVLNSFNKNLVEKYSFLFSVDCNLINAEEFNMLEKIDDVRLIISLIPPSLVTRDDAKMFAQYFSKKFFPNKTAFQILMFISFFENDVAEYCFDLLDFDNAIKYDTFSAEKKSTVKDAFSSILNLSSASGKIHFMEKTKWADSTFDITLGSALKNNTSLQEEYIGALTKCNIKSVTSSTVRLLRSLSKVYALPDIFTDKVFFHKEYKYYIVSKTWYHGKFVIESGDKFDLLWPYYVEIFASPSYPKTRKYMADNEKFIEMVISKKAYEDFPKENFMMLNCALQDKSTLDKAMSYGERFALEYLSSIKGFADEDAATHFLDIVASNSLLLSSNILYEHTHEKLVSGVLKGRYTRMRKKAGIQ